MEPDDAVDAEFGTVVDQTGQHSLNHIARPT